MGDRALEEKIEEEIHDKLTDEVVRDDQIPHVDIDTDGGMTRNDVRAAMDNFIHSPQMNGFDSDLRMVLLFTAIKQEVQNRGGRLESTHCEVCNNHIDAERFSEEFINAYNAKKVSQKQTMSAHSIKALANMAMQKWRSAVFTIAKNVVPEMIRYVRTEPSELNDNPNFPYIIKGTNVFHQNCYNQRQDE